MAPCNHHRTTRAAGTAAVLAADADGAGCTVMLPGAIHLEPTMAFYRTTVRYLSYSRHAFFSGFCFMHPTLISQLPLLRSDTYSFKIWSLLRSTIRSLTEGDLLCLPEPHTHLQHIDSHQMKFPSTW